MAMLPPSLSGSTGIVSPPVLTSTELQSIADANTTNAEAAAVSLAQQNAINAAVASAFVSGQAHDYYGLIGVMALAVVAALFPDYALPLLVGIVIIGAAIFTDLWAHGWTH